MCSALSKRRQWIKQMCHISCGLARWWSRRQRRRLATQAEPQPWLQPPPHGEHQGWVPGEGRCKLQSELCLLLLQEVISFPRMFLFSIIEKQTNKQRGQVSVRVFCWSGVPFWRQAEGWATVWSACPAGSVLSPLPCPPKTQAVPYAGATTVSKCAKQWGGFLLGTILNRNWL